MIQHPLFRLRAHQIYDIVVQRICYILPGFCADESDWCIPVLRKFIERMARDLEVVVYTPHYPYRRSTYSAFGATVHCLSDRRESGIGRLLLWRELARRIRSDHAASPFDLIHAFWATEIGFLASWNGMRLGIPTIVSIGGGELAGFPAEKYGAQLSPTQRGFVSYSLDRASTITAGSRWVASRVPDRFRAKLRTIPLGVDPEMFAPGELRTGRRLLAAMSFIPLKNYPTILRAVALARRELPGLTLDIASDGVERPHIESMIQQLDLGDIVRLLGHVPYDAMPDLYHRSDLLLHSSLYESEGMVILEALATGLPVISTDVGIAAELPDDLVYRFESRNAVELAALIVRSLSTPAHARHAFTSGPPLIRRAFSVTTQSTIFRELYEELIASS